MLSRSLIAEKDKVQTSEYKALSELYQAKYSIGEEKQKNMQLTVTSDAHYSVCQIIVKVGISRAAQWCISGHSKQDLDSNPSVGKVTFCEFSPMSLWVLRYPPTVQRQ